MDTYRIRVKGKGVVNYVTSTVQGDLSRKEVITKALEAGLLKEGDKVIGVEHWPAFDHGDTTGATWHLMGRCEVAKGLKPYKDLNGETVGFELPNGDILRIQVTMELEHKDNYRDLGTCDLEELGILGFGETDEKSIRLEEEDG